MEEMRERLVSWIKQQIDYDIDDGREIADCVLAFPEIKEALRSQCSSCDGARGPLLCTECVRDFIKAA